MQPRAGRRAGELSPLTDSLSSVIRWRYRDYESILRAELHLLIARPSSPARALRRFVSAAGPHAPKRGSPPNCG